MLTIGEFSKVCKLSVKALRYYDEIGLIKPDEINSKSGYRYYSIDQLKRIIFINRLKSYQFSLEEIKEILDYNKDEYGKKLEEALLKKKEDMLEAINNISASVKQIQCDIDNIRNGEELLSFIDKTEVKLCESCNINVVSMRKYFTKKDLSYGYIRHYNELYKKIAEKKLTITGAPRATYHSSEYSLEGLDIELMIPVKESVKGTKEIKSHLSAMSVLHGTYNNLTVVYAKIMEWIDKEGYYINGSPYEVYLSDPFSIKNENDNVTEVYFPIKKK